MNLKMLVGAMAVIGVAGMSQGALVIVNNLPGTFIDISPAGSGIGIDSGVHGDDLSGSIPCATGNVILPAGNNFVGSNGMLTTTAFTTFTNAALSALSVRGYYPFWDDLRSDNAGPPPGTIYYANLPGVTVVQWNNIGTFSGGAGTGTFEIQIFDGSSGILAQYLYRDVDFGGATNFGASATIGAVDGPVEGFAQWSFNVASIQNGSILTIVPGPSSLALLGLGGLLAGRRRR